MEHSKIREFASALAFFVDDYADLEGHEKELQDKVSVLEQTSDQLLTEIEDLKAAIVKKDQVINSLNGHIRKLIKESSNWEEAALVQSSRLDSIERELKKEHFKDATKIALLINMLNRWEDEDFNRAELEQRKRNLKEKQVRQHRNRRNRSRNQPLASCGVCQDLTYNRDSEGKPVCEVCIIGL